MYLRVQVREQDRGAQRFLWRGADRNRAPDAYEIQCLVFGENCAPTNAIYVKNRKAARFEAHKPEAALSIVKNCYMDDYLASGETAGQVRALARVVISINWEVNFEFHKWASNDARVLNDIPPERRLASDKNASLGNQEDKVLGL